MSPNNSSLNFYLFENGNNQVSLTMILTPPSGSSGSQFDITSTGLAGQGVTTILEDDPIDFLLPWDDTTGTMTSFFSPSSSNDIDGMILGYLPSAANSFWSLTIDFSVHGGFSQIAIWYLVDPFVSEDTALILPLSRSIPPNTVNTVTFSRTGETVVAVSEPASLLFPLAAMVLIGGIARHRRRR
ncbi:MAG: hypothetical protein ACI9JL_000144 [Paracoccaceae bacterium]